MGLWIGLDYVLTLMESRHQKLDMTVELNYDEPVEVEEAVDRVVMITEKVQGAKRNML